MRWRDFGLFGRIAVRFRKLIVVILAGGLAVAGFLASNPLRRSDAAIARWIERMTPMGSSLSDVETAAVARGWFRYRENDKEDGYWRFRETYVRGELGEYQGVPFRTSVTAFWEFDSADRLVKVRIWKTRDGL